LGSQIHDEPSDPSENTRHKCHGQLRIASSVAAGSRRRIGGANAQRAVHGCNSNSSFRVGHHSCRWCHASTSRRYWLIVPVASWGMACHSFQYFNWIKPQIQYRPVVGEGTWYVLRENVRFFEPFRYGATCVDVQSEL
jgi:hypothetical protein